MGIGSGRIVGRYRIRQMVFPRFIDADVEGGINHAVGKRKAYVVNLIDFVLGYYAVSFNEIHHVGVGGFLGLGAEKGGHKQNGGD